LTQNVISNDSRPILMEQGRSVYCGQEEVAYTSIL